MVRAVELHDPQATSLLEHTVDIREDFISLLHVPNAESHGRAIEGFGFEGQATGVPKVEVDTLPETPGLNFPLADGEHAGREVQSCDPHPGMAAADFYGQFSSACCQVQDDSMSGDSNGSGESTPPQNVLPQGQKTVLEIVGEGNGLKHLLYFIMLHCSVSW